VEKHKPKDDLGVILDKKEEDILKSFFKRFPETKKCYDSLLPY
jgi:hypothetical protein